MTTKDSGDNGPSVRPDTSSPAANAPKNARDDKAIDAAFNAIDFEIAETRATQQSPGWSLWAVLAALVANTWLISDVLKTDKVTQESVLHLFLLLSLGLDAVLSLAELFGIEHPLFPPRVEKRVRNWRDVTARGLELLVVAIRNAVLIWIVACAWPGVSWWARAAAYVDLLGLFVALLLAVVAIPFIRIPIQVGITKQDTRLRMITLLLFTALPLAALIGYTRAIMPSAKLLTVADWRLAGLLVVFLSLLAILARVAGRSSTLAPLIQVRRDLAFGRIEPDTALLRVDAILVGKKASDFVEEETERIQNIYKKIDRARDRAITAANALAAKYQVNGSVTSVVPEIEVKRWWERDVGRWQKQFASLQKEWKRVARRLKWLTAGDAEATTTAETATARLFLEVLPKKAEQQLLELLQRRKALLGQTSENEAPPAQ